MDRRRLALSLLATPLFLALLLFLPAGTWAWVRGWLFVLVFLVAFTLAALYLLRVNPEVVVARSRTHRGTKGWDRTLLGFWFLAFGAIFPVAALDDGRCHWLPVPWWACGLGYALLLAGVGVVTWEQAVNKFFELTVRIQADRGQKVIDTGPYAVVRHPGYVAGILLCAGSALCLLDARRPALPPGRGEADPGRRPARGDCPWSVVAYPASI